ncbi:uncharacterized protein HD556DRAFT_1328623 [Suillus plorans]|uniref:Secreted protein n=1 Tax=Suillus plorans TaxID=116603 RepID=A0A9P7DX88_9AGAM|nr:uncharacterized protein HD556DRAFT_1328623 [Suillus plorans]KAG1805112.1 hypothetical protein HD556DRAFT_1328623 [Suillus plorans]
MVKCMYSFILVLFVHAFNILTGHRALWERGVHHCNVSLSNIMGYHLHGQFIGVLNDYDLIVILPSSYIPPTMNCIVILSFDM